jgi:predicted nucleic acid-binding protein
LILDTNALSAFFDDETEAVQMVSRARAVAIPVIVAGEFAFGIEQSRHREAYEKALRRMLERCSVLNIDLDTAQHYAAIRHELKSAGKPIPANDVWIAALSRQHSMPVMSRDSHFDFVGGVVRRGW